MKKFLISIIVLFVLLRLPSIFEWLWYGDEGIYAFGADTIKNGGTFYLDAWDHKPPMMSWIYLLGSVVGWSIGYPIIKVLSMLAGISSIFLLYKIFQYFKIITKWQKVGLVFFVVLIGTPILEGNVANAELFFMPFVLIVFYTSLVQKYEIYSGLALLACFLIKPQAFLESLGIIFFVYVFSLLKSKLNTKFLIRQFGVFLLSLGVFLLSLVFAGSFREFIDAVFVVNFGYSSGGAISKIIFLVVSLAIIGTMFFLAKRKKLSSEYFLLVSIFLADLFLVGLSGRAYPHYLLQIIPIFVLLTIYVLSHLKKRIYIKLIYLLIFLLSIIIYFFQNLSAINLKSLDLAYLNYYLDFARYIGGDQNTKAWFWRGHDSFTKEKAFVDYFNAEYAGIKYYYYGEDPWVPAQLDAQVSNKYIVWYHLTFSDDKMKEAIKQLDDSTVLLVDKRSPVFLEDFFKEVEDNFVLIDTLEEFEIYAKNE